MGMLAVTAEIASTSMWTLASGRGREDEFVDWIATGAGTRLPLLSSQDT